MKKLFCFVSCTVVFIAAVGCEKSLEKKHPAKSTHDEVKVDSIVKTNDSCDKDAAGATLLFSLKLDPDVYEHSDYGEPPQFVIWLEDVNQEQIRTVWVTHRTGSGDWAGKVECPVSLPYWVSRYNKEAATSGPPTFRRPVIDAITGATPKQDFTVKTEVVSHSKWRYFIEVNVSGDFNIHFPAYTSEGIPDPQGNGQPSLIYQGQIEAIDGASDSPKLVGRTDQWQPVDHIIEDLECITDANNLISEIEVRCIDPN